jgi:hypothetical protein
VIAKNTLKIKQREAHRVQVHRALVKSPVQHVRVVQDQRHERDHLHGGLVLATATGRDHNALADRDRPESRNRQLSSGNDDHSPCGNVPQLDHQHQGREHDQLVSQRIEELPEHAGQAHLAGQIAVDKVCDRRQRIQNCGPKVPHARVLVHQPQHDRDHHNPRHGEQIRQI